MQRKNLWAPWRIKYVQGLGENGDENGCFICDYRETPEKDNENLVLWRTELSLVMFNRFPYNNGHLLIAPVRHIATLDEADDREMLELIKFTSNCQKVLTQAIKPHGFNVGMNFGRCAGAGLPGHLHIHIVPRWNGDTNFMHVCSDTNVISQNLAELYRQLREISIKDKLPNL